MFYIYMLRCEDNSLYTGFTTDIKRRWQEHLDKDKPYAKYTRSHPVKSIAALWVCESRSGALKLEYHLKKLNKQQKEYLIKNPDELNSLFSSTLECGIYTSVVIDNL